MKEHALLKAEPNRKLKPIYHRDETDDYRNFYVVEQFTDKKGIVWYHVNFDLIYKETDQPYTGIKTTPGKLDGWLQASEVDFSITKITNIE
ncbi:MAG TPA: hypothetical protein VD905_02710 [Flavobacteriales bacterium]|nr:hypothetical protein [Flavobacteriales bacterium]